MDHIIPKTVALELNMPELVFDRRNLRMACQSCNWKRRDNVNDLPLSVQIKLAERRKTLYAIE